MDELGSGVRNVYRFADLYDPGAVPTFIEGDVFKVIVPLRGARSETTVEGTVEEMLRLLKNDPKLTIKRLQEHIGLSRRGIEYHISKLKTEGKLQRIGSTTSGHWQVIDK